ncbi:MAG: tetratricopeptide repeat protein [Massilia sp.]
MSQFRLARLCVMLAAVGLAPALMTNAFAQKNDAPAAAPKADSVRPEIFKLLDPAAIKPLMDAKNYTEVQNRITQAEAIPNRTPYEDYVINRMKLPLASLTGNEALTISTLEAVINSGKLQPAEQADFTQTLGTMYYNAKNYPKAIETFKRYQKESATPEKVRAALVRSYYLSGDYAAAKAELAPVIAEAEKAGKAPSQEDLKLLLSAANEQKDSALYLSTLEKMVTYYPTDDLWTHLLARGVFSKPGFDQQNNAVEAFRLKYAAVKKLAPEEYVDLAELALQAGFPTEAKKVVDQGFAAGELGTGASAAKHRQLRDRATKGAADDARNIASGEASAAKSKNGAGLVNIGWAYVTMDQYDKGIGFIEQGIAKGGLKQPDDAKLRLGIAQYRAGRKADAVKTLQGVKAGGGLSDLAKYWILLINSPAQANPAPVAGK